MGLSGVRLLEDPISVGYIVSTIKFQRHFGELAAV
jgi:hypothetical protein